MAALERLFGDTSTGSRGDDTGDADEIARLRSLVGGGGPTVDAAEADADTQTGRIRALVGRPSAAGSVSDATISTAGADPAPTMRQRRSAGRRTASVWVNGGVAVLAIVAVVAVVGVVVVQSTSSSEAAQAAQSLRAQETDLRNRTTTLKTALSLYDAAVKDAGASADAGEAALTALEGRSDETARAGALQALTAFREAIEVEEAPAAPQAYERAPGTPDDLTAVAAQLDGVRAAAAELEVAIDEARSARAQAARDQATFAEAMAGFGATLPAAAEIVTAENAAAGDEFRAAVADAAAEVGVAQKRGSLGFAEMAAYAAAVDALRVENERALAAQATQPVARRNRGWVAPRSPAPPAQEEQTPPSDGGAPPAEEQPPVESPADPVEPGPGANG